MDEKETTSLLDIVEAGTGFPEPVRKGVIKAINELLGGLTEIPAAWIKRPAKAINDTTAGRSVVADALAKGVAEEALKDPVVMQAATEIYMPTIVRKARNRVKVAQRTVEHASETTSDGTGAASPDDDWMNAFMRFAEDASSEKLQDMFGRILAGEVIRPGSFTLTTLRTVAELDQSIAQDFSLVWEKSVGEAVDYSWEFKRGEWFSRWKRLAEAGLVAVTNSVQFLPEFRPTVDGNAIWSPMKVEQTYLLVHFPENCSANWDHIDFTRTGRQLGSILPRPNFEANMREVGKKLSSRGVARVELYSAGKMEILYSAPAA